MLDRIKALFVVNRVVVGGHRYTRPAHSTYEHQWLWDSCFHAIILRHFDVQMAVDELLSLIVHQVKTGADAGMIPHMAYWKGGGVELWGVDDRSIITQPPLIAIAAQLVYETSPNQNLLAALYPALCAYHDWFDRRRDPDNDHLVSLIHPWESGWDASPRWDRPMKLSDDPTDDESRLARIALVKQLIEYDCDALKLAEQGLFHVEAADFNAIRAADLEALAWMADQLGEDGQRWRTKAEAVKEAIVTKLYRGNHVLDLSGLDETPLDERTAASFVTLISGAFSEMYASDLVIALYKSEWWTHYPVTTTPMNSRLYRPHRYWRGNVWLNVNWLIWKGLLRYGAPETARKLAERSIELAQEHDFHEYFHPQSGDGYGSYPHSWSGIVLDMIDRRPIEKWYIRPRTKDDPDLESQIKRELTGRSFQLWDYRVPLNRLLIRSPRRNPDDYNLDIIFMGVQHLNIEHQLGEITIEVELADETLPALFKIHSQTGTHTIIAASCLVTQSYTTFLVSALDKL